MQPSASDCAALVEQTSGPWLTICTVACAIQWNEVMSTHLLPHGADGLVALRLLNFNAPTLTPTLIVEQRLHTY